MKNKRIISFVVAAMLLVSTSVWAKQVSEYKPTTNSRIERVGEHKPVNLQVTDQSKIERDYQMETISKLLLGYYHGAIKVCEILNMGTVVENPAKIDRSIVVFNNKLYQLVEKEPLDDPSLQRTTSLATIHGMDKPIELENIKDISNMSALQFLLESEVSKQNKSQTIFYIVQIKGEFSDLVLQDVPGREWVDEQIKSVGKPYKMHKYKHAQGTIVGIRMFDYLKSSKSIVWYLHFASDDKKISGVVSSAKIKNASLKLNPISELSIYMPVWKD